MGARPHRPLPALQQSLLTMEEIQLVEETQIKERKCLLKIRGGKQFVLQCDVSGGLGVGPGRARGAGPRPTASVCRVTQSWCSGRRSCETPTAAQQLVQRGAQDEEQAAPPVVELSKVPLIQRSANGL